MESINGFFDIEQQDNLMIVTPNADMGELDYERINTGMKQVIELLASSTVKNLIIDFHKTSYYGSTALGFFVRLWKTISSRDGRMAFCNLSEHEKEILTVTKLDNLWPICTSKAEALKTVRG